MWAGWTCGTYRKKRGPWTFMFWTVLDDSHSMTIEHITQMENVSSYQFWDKCTEWPLNDIEHYKVKGCFNNNNLFIFYSTNIYVSLCWTKLKVVHCTCIGKTSQKFPWTGLRTEGGVMFWNFHSHMIQNYRKWNKKQEARVALLGYLLKEYRSQKIGIHRMTPNWTWTPNSQKYSIYTKYLTL